MIKHKSIKFNLDIVCKALYKNLINHKLIVLFLFLILTPLVIFLLSVYGLKINALSFTSILTIIIYLIYLNIYFASKNYKIAIILVFILSFVLKMFLAFNLFGTYDMKSFYIVSKLMDKGITTNIYAETDRYNYSPIWAITIYLITQLSKISNISLSALLKFPIIIFDALTALLIYKICKESSNSDKKAFLLVASFLYNPLTIMVSSHGSQFDAIAIYFLLLYYYISKKSMRAMHYLIYGISIAVKQVTVFPLLFFLQRLKGYKKLLFLFLVPLPFFLLLSPYLFSAWRSLLRNVLTYSGTGALWGYSRIVQYILTFFGLNNLQLIFKFYIAKIIVIFIFGLIFYYFHKYKNVSLLQGIIVSYLIFFALTPGFGVQYLVWILPFAILEKNYFYYIYSFLGSLMAFLFYYGHGTGNLFIREVLAFSVVGPLLWIFCIYWLFRRHLEIKTRHSIGNN